MDRNVRYFTIKEFNKILYDATHAIIKYQKSMKLIDKPFKKQIMLAVSQVNQCAICSHVHTKALIKSGASNEELKNLLKGSFKNLNEDISLALIFAEHYADEMGNYDKEAFQKLISYYGVKKANGIMATIKIIMFGNTNGINLTNLINRLRFKRNKNSNFITELYNGLLAYPLLLIFLFINLFTKKQIY